MPYWSSAAYKRSIGLLPPIAITVLFYNQIIDDPPPIVTRWITKFHTSILPFFATPIIHKRELRHVIVPCGAVNFDVYILGCNHRTTRSSADVSKLLQLVKPDVIFVELCRSREEMLYDEEYKKSEYYAAASYRREQGDTKEKIPLMMLGDRPLRISDRRWYDSLETVASQITSYLIWPFIMPFRDRLWGYEILINERDIFMAYELEKCLAYFTSEEEDINERRLALEVPVATLHSSIDSDKRSICTRLMGLRKEQTSSITLNAYFQAMCGILPIIRSKESSRRQPSVVAIIGSNHLDGVCKLLENEKTWSSKVLSDVVSTERYSENHPYTIGIVNDVEEYDRNVRVKDHINYRD